jgi:hypothetical protein
VVEVMAAKLVANNRSAFGRINPTNDLPATQPGIPAPAGSSNARLVPDGASAPVSTFGGNLALTSPGGRIDFSSVDTYAVSTNSGVRCAGTNCVEGNSNSNFFIPGGGGNPDIGLPIGSNQGLIAVNNGVTEAVNFTALLAEISSVRSFLTGLATGDFTATLNLSSSGGSINNFNSNDAGDFIVGDHLTLVDGLNIIQIETNGSDFSINNSNFIVNGDSNDFFIFLVDEAPICWSPTRGSLRAPTWGYRTSFLR